ncbi:hypothetical protein GA0070564_101998 [Micromonospora mirobrigensis]|uniref:Uncharacterized protein n=1 Tax=Micromonospora mirobrigensis TaxID=262898 RepID=A0A1C4V755_9ACTN|nr:hypothetical protein GA0070564_101998 [Micromonospora mirobrigensis]
MVTALVRAALGAVRGVAGPTGEPTSPRQVPAPAAHHARPSVGHPPADSGCRRSQRPPRRAGTAGGLIRRAPFRPDDANGSDRGPGRLRRQGDHGPGPTTQPTTNPRARTIRPGSKTGRPRTGAVTQRREPRTRQAPTIPPRPPQAGSPPIRRAPTVGPDARAGLSPAISESSTPSARKASPQVPPGETQRALTPVTRCGGRPLPPGRRRWRGATRVTPYGYGAAGSTRRRRARWPPLSTVGHSAADSRAEWEYDDEPQTGPPP